MAGPELLHREVLSSPRWHSAVLTAILATIAFAAGWLTAECCRAAILDRASPAQREARARARAVQRELDAAQREVDAAQRAFAEMRRGIAEQQRSGQPLPVVPLRIDDAPRPPDPVCGGGGSTSRAAATASTRSRCKTPRPAS